MPELVVPHPRFRESYATALIESLRAREFARASLDDVSGGAFSDLVRGVLAERDEAAAAALGRVPATTWWWVEGDEYLGRISIRHRLTEELARLGGHVGYDVRPSARRRGHATAMLRAALPLSASLGLARVLVTCDVGNEGSRKVIEANRGVFDDVCETKRRYWIET